MCEHPLGPLRAAGSTRRLLTAGGRGHTVGAMPTLKIDGARFILSLDPERRIIENGSILTGVRQSSR